MKFFRNLFPFKPFKSKRGIRQGIDEVNLKIVEVQKQQTTLVEAWLEGVEVKGLKLETHKQGSHTVRWRLTVKETKERKYVKLFTSETAYITDRLESEAIELLSVFEHHRIIVNAKSRSLAGTLAALSTALKEIENIPVPTNVD